MSKAKPFCISKREVWEAYKRVKANQGAAGVDEQSIADFERNLKGNLYRACPILLEALAGGNYGELVLKHKHTIVFDFGKSCPHN
jgi:hypothetical protein